MIRIIRLLLVTMLAVGFLNITTGSVVSAFSLLPDNETCEDARNNNTEDPRAERQPTVCQDSDSNSNPIYGPNGVVALAASILSIIIGVVAVIVIIIAGIQYMLSTGDPTKVNNAKNAILYALVGLAVAAIARFVVPFILGKL